MSANEYRVFGPPGTGKTTFLGTQVRKWATEYGSDKVAVASFTKAAAAEVAGRDLPVRREQIGTLHSFAFRALGLTKEDVAQSHIREFNDTHPAYQLSGAINDGVEDLAADVAVGATDADEIMLEVQALRARQVPIEAWSVNTLALHTAWSDWCEQSGYVDFTAMIEEALVSVPTMPGNPAVGLFDEAQDFTPLELALVRSWGAQMETVLVAGDDDQCIYGFKGASPYVFLDPPVDDDHKRVLSQSYRVPEKVHRLSQEWIQQVTRREAKAYAPRTDNDEVVEGTVRLLHAGMGDPVSLVEAAATEAAKGRSVMILATCSYMLRPILHELRDTGTPFQNAYRTRRGDWNPLGRGGSRRRMPVDRVLAFLRPEPEVWGEFSRMWTGGDARAWIELVRSKGLLKHGGKVWLGSEPAETAVSTPDMHDHLWLDPNDEIVMALERCDLNALRASMLATALPKYEFIFSVARKHGAAALRSDPLITIGTVHSVKGGQADVVYLLPDLSAQGYEQWDTPSTADEVVRLFYVGMTRAREELVLCEGGSARSVPLHDFARKALR